MFMIRPSRIMAVKPRLGIIKTTSARPSCSRIQKTIPADKQYTISTAITTSKLNSPLLKTSCSVSKSTLSSVKYQCPKCDFQAEDKNDMKKHVVVAHKSKPFVCFHCEETFSNFKVMQSHVKALHPEVGVIKEPYALVSEIENTKLKGSSKTAKVTKPVPSEHGSLPQEINAVESGPALLQLDAKISDAGSNKDAFEKSSKRTMLSTKGTNPAPSDQDSLPQEIDLMPSSPTLSKSAARASNVKGKKIRKNTKDEPVLKKSQSIQAEELAAKNQTQKNVQLEMVVDAMLNEESGILHEINVSKSPSLQASVVQSFNKARDMTHELKPKSKKIKKLNESKGSVKSAELTAKNQTKNKAKKNQQVDSEIEEMLKMFEKGQKSKSTTIKDNKLNIEQLNINAVKDKKVKDEDYLLKESHEKILPIKQTMKGKRKKIGKQNIEPVIDESIVLQSNTVMSAKLLPKEQRKQLLKEQKEKEEQKAKEEKLLKEQKEKEERELKEKQLFKEQKEKEEQLLKEQKEKEERKLKGEQLLKEQKEKEEKLLKEQKEKKLKEKQEQLLKEQKEKAEQKAKEEKLLKEQKEKLLKEMEERKIKEQKEKQLLLNEQKEKEEQKAKEEKLLREQKEKEERELKEKQLLKEQKEKEEKLLKEQKEKEERELKEQQLLKEQKEKEEKLLKEQKEKKLKEKQEQKEKEERERKEQKEKEEQKAKEEKLLKEQKEKEEGELKEQNEKVQKEKLLKEKELLLKEQKEREIKEQKEKEQLLKEQKEKEEREIKEQKENEQRLLKEQKESEEQKAKEEQELKAQLCEKSETKHSEHSMPTDVKSIKTAFQQDIKKELKTDSQENKPGLLNWFKSFISRK